jgi:hypothetical protein
MSISTRPSRRTYWRSSSQIPRLIFMRMGVRAWLDEHGRIELRVPLERSSRRNRGFGCMLAVIEESVSRELANSISFSAWLLEHVDPTQRATHVGLAATLDASDHMGWRTRAEQDASPNSGTMRIALGPDAPVTLDRPRAALKFDAARLAEDLTVHLRRQRKAQWADRIRFVIGQRRPATIWPVTSGSSKKRGHAWADRKAPTRVR